MYALNPRNVDSRRLHVIPEESHPKYTQNPGALHKPSDIDHDHEVVEEFQRAHTPTKVCLLTTTQRHPNAQGSCRVCTDVYRQDRGHHPHHPARSHQLFARVDGRVLPPRSWRQGRRLLLPRLAPGELRLFPGRCSVCCWQGCWPVFAPLRPKLTVQSQTLNAKVCAKRPILNTPKKRHIT